MSATIDPLAPGLTAKAFDAAEINLEPGESAFVAWLTLDSVDREGDVVVPSGIDFRSEYLDTNPVVMACHEYNRWPVGTCAWIKPKRNRGFNGLIARATVDTADPDSRRLFGLIQRRVVRSVSIGFRPPDDFKPGEWGPPTPEELKARPDWKNARRVIRRCVLVEFSVVPIGMHPFALIDAVSKGLELPSYLTHLLPAEGKSMSDEELKALKQRIRDAAAELCETHALEAGSHKVYLNPHSGHVHWQADALTPKAISAKITERMKAVPGVNSFEITALPSDEDGDVTLVYPDIAGASASGEPISVARDDKKGLGEDSGTGGGYVTEPEHKDGGGDADDMAIETEAPPHLKLKAGDYVEHGMGRSAICGKIVSVHKSGFVPGVEEDVEGTESEPAARVKCYLKSAQTGLYHPTTKHVGRLCKELVKVAHPMAEGEDMPYPENDAPKAVSTATIKGVVPFAKGPTDESEWDSAAARASVAKWASSDGSGETAKIDWAKYAQAFAWVNPDRAEEVGGYRLIHRVARDGKLYVSRRGVEVAYRTLKASTLHGVPAEHEEAVAANLAKHYAEWGCAPGTDGKSIKIPIGRTYEEVRDDVLAKALGGPLSADAIAQATTNAAIDKMIGAV